MATYRGLDGSITWAAGTVGEVKGWTLNMSGELLDDTSMGDKWRSKKGGLADWNASAVCHLDYGDVNQKAMIDTLLAATPTFAAVAVEFLVATGKKFTGNAIVVGITINQQLDNIVELNVSLEGSGPPSAVWA